ncbi:MAG TPA: hypothetical protein VGO08_00535, partial [Burkholderiales bacterium]|nr:hypothetical protein [Burkholderiales bacterium]
MFEHGLTMVSTSTSGVGVGIGAMVGAARTRGHHVTAVSARAAPPRRRDYGPQLALAVGCFLLGFPYHIVWIGAVLFGIAVAVAVDWNRREWPSLYSTWDAKYMCERCGEIDFSADQSVHAMVIADVAEHIRRIPASPAVL